MVSIAAYDHVVSQIYEAALVPANWDVALTSLVNLFGPREWEVAMLLWERLDPPMGRFIGTAGLNPLARDTYLTLFAGRHEWTVRSHAMKLGTVAHSDDLIARDRFLETPFYKHFVGPWGFEVALIGMLDRQSQDHMGLVCPGPPGVDPGELRTAIIRLTPHFQRAARISRRIGEADLRLATAANMLDNSPYCVLALGADLDVLLANQKAEALLESVMGIARNQGRLRIDNGKLARTLSEMARGEASERSFAFTLEGRNGERLLMTALAVDQSQSGQFANHAGGTSLMIVGGQRIIVSEAMIDAVQQSFDLTAAEARLAAHLIEGSGVDGYARARGVSINAGKYLLKSIYAKTSLSNQAALVALLREAPLGWGMPITGLST
jgi:DNA-binding CsgD family transcriptional regulator